MCWSQSMQSCSTAGDCSPCSHDVGCATGVNLQSFFLEVGRKFGCGGFLNSAESLCNRRMEQNWMLGQDTQIVRHSETGEIWSLRTCDKGDFTLS